MIRYLKIFYLPIFIFVILACRDSDENSDGSGPLIVSSSPQIDACDVPIGTSLTLTFDEEIILLENHNIKVNNQLVEASVSGNVLTIDVSLKYGVEYTVQIPFGNVKDVDSNFAKNISFRFKTIETVVDVKSDLAVANPSPEAVKVYNFLKENYGSKIISSSMANVNFNINEALWVYKHTGKYPAMATFDYGHLPASPANWIDYSKISVAEDWWTNNGLIGAGWHWVVPRNEGFKDVNKFTFYSDSTTFSASNALIEGTWENKIMKADLEKLAGYLLLLKDKNIPVVWRPLHEAAGNIYEYTNGTAWFWWGAKGGETYKKLWIYMFDYFKSKGLNNLIWVWTTQTKDRAFYPGDAYVDIVGRDIYNKSDASAIKAEFEAIQKEYPTRIVTLSECGNVAAISKQWSAGAKWSFFMPWYDHARTNVVNSAAFALTDHEHANVAWWKDAVASDDVITRDEMPSLK